jgi:hypothetical protein
MFVGELSSDDRFEPAPAQDVWPMSDAQSDASNDVLNTETEGRTISISSEPCGQVVLAGSRPGQAVQVLFEAQTGAVEGGKLGVKDLLGHWHDLRVRPLPYALLEI